jgi:hypothetical protein
MTAARCLVSQAVETRIKRGAKAMSSANLKGVRIERSPHGLVGPVNTLNLTGSDLPFRPFRDTEQ